MAHLTDLKERGIGMRFGVEVIWVVKYEWRTAEGFVIGVSVLERPLLRWCLCVLRWWIKEELLRGLFIGELRGYLASVRWIIPSRLLLHCPKVSVQVFFLCSHSIHLYNLYLKVHHILCSSAVIMPSSCFMSFIFWFLANMLPYLIRTELQVWRKGKDKNWLPPQQKFYRKPNKLLFEFACREVCDK